MKILHLANMYAPAGGVETYVLELLPLLAAQGCHNALIYRQQHPRTPPTAGKPIHHVPVTARPAHDRAQIAAIIDRERPTVIYLHDVYDPELVALAAQMAPTVGYIHIFYPVCPGLAKLYRRGDQVCTRPYGLGCAPMIYWRRCASARHPRSVYRIMRRTERHLAAYRSLPGILVASQYMKSLLLQNRMPAERVAVLPYFIPIPPAVETPALPAQPPGILFAGRLEYEKGLPYLLHALRHIQRPHRLLVAGDGSLAQDYADLARTLGVANRVQFAGWLSAEELAAAYRRCALAVMPTIMPEPFGKVGVEAMAHGRPVVAFDVGGIADWLKDGYNGFLAPPGDIQGLAVRIDRLLADADLAARLGANGRRYVAQTYAADHHVSRLLQILHAVAQG